MLNTATIGLRRPSALFAPHLLMIFKVRIVSTISDDVTMSCLLRRSISRLFSQAAFVGNWGILGGSCWCVCVRSACPRSIVHCEPYPWGSAGRKGRTKGRLWPHSSGTPVSRTTFCWRILRLCSSGFILGHYRSARGLCNSGICGNSDILPEENQR